MLVFFSWQNDCICLNAIFFLTLQRGQRVSSALHYLPNHIPQTLLNRPLHRSGFSACSSLGRIAPETLPPPAETPFRQDF